MVLRKTAEVAVEKKGSDAFTTVWVKPTVPASSATTVTMWLTACMTAIGSKALVSSTEILGDFRSCITANV